MGAAGRTAVTRVRIAGRGRAGSAFAAALAGVDGFDVELVAHDHASADDVDALVLAVPDAAIAATALAVTPVSTTAVLHLSGSLGLDVLAPHERRASVHPLLALANVELGAQRLRNGAWFAVAGDAIAREIVDALGGRALDVGDLERVAYHAAACIASNHVVALLAQAERVAATAGVPFAAYLDLVDATLANVREVGPVAALTGPAARGDTDTVARHIAVLPDDERALYAIVAEACRAIGLQR